MRLKALGQPAVRTPLPDLYPAIALERSQYLGGLRHVLQAITVRETRDSCPSHMRNEGGALRRSAQEALQTVGHETADVSQQSGRP